MEIYQRKPNKTTQWYTITNNQEEIHTMLDSATTYSTIPSDSYPIERKIKTNFTLYLLQAYFQCKTKTIQSWIKYIQQLDKWTKFLIQHHTFQQGSESLLLYLTQQANLILATDGSTYERINSGIWSITLENGSHIITWHNPNFGQVKQKKSSERRYMLS